MLKICQTTSFFAKEALACIFEADYVTLDFFAEAQSSSSLIKQIKNIDDRLLLESLWRYYSQTPKNILVKAHIIVQLDKLQRDGSLSWNDLPSEIRIYLKKDENSSLKTLANLLEFSNVNPPTTLPQGEKLLQEYMHIIKDPTYAFTLDYDSLMAYIEYLKNNIDFQEFPYKRGFDFVLTEAIEKKEFPRLMKYLSAVKLNINSLKKLAESLDNYNFIIRAALLVQLKNLQFDNKISWSDLPAEIKIYLGEGYDNPPKIFSDILAFINTNPVTNFWLGTELIYSYINILEWPQFTPDYSKAMPYIEYLGNNVNPQEFPYEKGIYAILQSAIEKKKKDQLIAYFSRVSLNIFSKTTRYKLVNTLISNHANEVLASLQPILANLYTAFKAKNDNAITLILNTSPNLFNNKFLLTAAENNDWKCIQAYLNLRTVNTETLAKLLISALNNQNTEIAEHLLTLDTRKELPLHDPIPTMNLCPAVNQHWDFATSGNSVKAPTITTWKKIIISKCKQNDFTIYFRNENFNLTWDKRLQGMAIPDTYSTGKSGSYYLLSEIKKRPLPTSLWELAMYYCNIKFAVSLAHHGYKTNHDYFLNSEKIKTYHPLIQEYLSLIDKNKLDDTFLQNMLSLALEHSIHPLISLLLELGATPTKADLDNAIRASNIANIKTILDANKKLTAKDVPLVDLATIGNWNSIFTYLEKRKISEEIGIQLLELALNSGGEFAEKLLAIMPKIKDSNFTSNILTQALKSKNDILVDRYIWHIKPTADHLVTAFEINRHDYIKEILKSNPAAATDTAALLAAAEQKKWLCVETYLEVSVIKLHPLKKIWKMAVDERNVNVASIVYKKILTLHPLDHDSFHDCFLKSSTSTDWNFTFKYFEKVSFTHVSKTYTDNLLTAALKCSSHYFSDLKQLGISVSKCHYSYLLNDFNPILKKFLDKEPLLSRPQNQAIINITKLFSDLVSSAARENNENILAIFIGCMSSETEKSRRSTWLFQSPVYLALNDMQNEFLTHLNYQYNIFISIEEHTDAYNEYCSTLPKSFCLVQ
jgi:hypothetical protein